MMFVEATIMRPKNKSAKKEMSEGRQGGGSGGAGGGQPPEKKIN